MSNAPEITIQPGGGFLVEHISAQGVFTPEDFSEEHLQIKATTSRFVDEQVIPNIGTLETKQDDLSRRLLEKASGLGLCSILVPERYGGLELDLTSQLIVTEQMGRYGSFSVTYGAHTGIGLLPLVFFGNQKQKQSYVSQLISGKWIAAYSLSESQAGSDALAVRTSAKLSSDNTHYVLNGEKMWISNGGWADLYTIFAKVDNKKFTAFLVERAMKGVKPGMEEKKMGIRGSSTTPVVLENVQVPIDNVLGEVGQGHVIAFNILNLGRMKLCTSCVGGSKDVLAETIRYAKQRKSFGSAICEFGLIKQKISEMAIRIFAAESMAYRISGMIDKALENISWSNEKTAAHTVLKTIEERAIECAMAKVYSSEVLDYVTDEGVQVHGGYGFHQDYTVERAYRDARINRIFEGTNEINRLLAVDMLLKRVKQGRLTLLQNLTGIRSNVEAVNVTETIDIGPLADEHRLVQQTKKIALLTLDIAYQHFGENLKDEQEVAAAISNILIDVYGAESALLRAEKLTLASHNGGESAAEMVRVLVADLIPQVRNYVFTVIATCYEGVKLQEEIKLLHRMTHFTPPNSIALRRRIAKRLIQAEKFVV